MTQMDNIVPIKIFDRGVQLKYI